MNRIGLLASALFLTTPAFAIVVGGSASSAVTYGQSFDGMNLGGVVEVQSSIGGCTGTLLADNLTILTAGHCVTSSYGSPLASNITVTFNGASGPVFYTVSTVSVDPAYTGDSTQGGDLATLTLSSPPPSFAIGYGIYLGATTTSPDLIAGYGLTGNGTSGAGGGYGTLNAGENEYVVNGSYFGWSSTLLVGEFYESGVPSTNALGSSVDPHPYAAADEVDISHGDSGGPTFYNGMIIGVHDLGVCLTDISGNCAQPPAVNSSNNSYYGDLYADVSVAANAGWIEAQEATPEPASLLLAAGALAGLAVLRRAR